MTLGDFKLDRFSACGASSEVWSARQISTGNLCAVKIINPRLRRIQNDTRLAERFALEQSVRIEHPNVVRTLDTGEEWIAMEWLHGSTVRNLLRQSGPMSEQSVRRVVVQVANGLTAVHEAGFVHGDMQTRNIMMGGKKCKLFDFGITSRIGNQIPGAKTIAMAPEQRAGQTCPASDTWGLGIAMWEMLIGRSPLCEGDIEWSLLPSGTLSGVISECLNREYGARPEMAVLAKL